MISNAKIMPTLAVTDLARAKRFYHETLGLKLTTDEPNQAVFESDDGSWLYVYRKDPSMAEPMVAGLESNNIESDVEELRRKGVTLGEFDFPEMGLKTEHDIMSVRGPGFVDKTAWFRDLEGNLLALHQRVRDREPEEEWEAVGAISGGEQDTPDAPEMLY